MSQFKLTLTDSMGGVIAESGLSGADASAPAPQGGILALAATLVIDPDAPGGSARLALE